jgi:hypothetical protein
MVHVMRLGSNFRQSQFQFEGDVMPGAIPGTLGKGRLNHEPMDEGTF